MKKVLVLNSSQAINAAIHAIRHAAEGDVVRVGPPTRTLEQNAAQWPILKAFSEQVMWEVNGYQCYMSDEDWKDVLTAAFHAEQTRFARGLNGGVVLLGQRTSKFDKKEFSDWLEFLHATAVELNVDLTKKNDVPQPQAA